MTGHDTVAVQDAPKRKKKSARALPPPSVTLTNGDWLGTAPYHAAVVSWSSHSVTD